MEFTLEEFAGEELKTYEVTRKITGDIDNPQGKDYKFTLNAFKGDITKSEETDFTSF